jgi:hypothetical protein
VVASAREAQPHRRFGHHRTAASYPRLSRQILRPTPRRSVACRLMRQADPPSERHAESVADPRSPWSTRRSLGGSAATTSREGQREGEDHPPKARETRSGTATPDAQHVEGGSRRSRRTRVAGHRLLIHSGDGDTALPTPPVGMPGKGRLLPQRRTQTGSQEGLHSSVSSVAGLRHEVPYDRVG